MALDLLIPLIAATLFMVFLPGPNVALIVATSLARGVRSGLVAVAGTTAGTALQLALTVFGLSALLVVAADALNWLKWAGAAYLIYLGWRTWTTPPADLDARPDTRANLKLFWGGLGVAVANPKMLIFNAAFLPQFVTADAGLSLPLQLAVVSAIFLSVMAAGDSVWVMLAMRARPMLARFGHMQNRIAGAIYIGAGAALALARR